MTHEPALPPLPDPIRQVVYNESKGYAFSAYTADQMRAYARAALDTGRPQYDWSLLEATQESLREHMAEIQRLRAALAQPAVSGELSSVSPKAQTEFMQALHGGQGTLDAWLECNNEAEVRAHVLALVHQPAASEEPVAWMTHHDEPMVEHITPLDPLDIETRLEELAQLRDGWLDGKGRAPERAALVRLAQAFDEHYAPDLQLPYLYPTAEGGVQAEWTLGAWEVSLEIALPAMAAQYQALHLKTGESRELDLTLASDDGAGWTALNAALKAVFPSQTEAAQYCEDDERPIPLYTAAASEELVGYANSDELDNMLDDRTAVISAVQDGFRKTPLYATAQPAPARVPLTDEQIDRITAEQWGRGLGAHYAAYRAYARAIEAAQGIAAPGAPDAQKGAA